MKILYIYGYGGSATGSTVTMLKRLMPEEYSVEDSAKETFNFDDDDDEILQLRND